MSIFQLHPRLQADCLVVGNLPLSQLLLMNNSQYPWFILVPRRHEVTEIYQLAIVDRQQLLTESCRLAEALQAIYQPDKLNIAAIGNLAPQLHLHHVARFKTDKVWPLPVWGHAESSAYESAQADAIIRQVRDALGDYLQ